MVDVRIRQPEIDGLISLSKAVATGRHIYRLQRLTTVKKYQLGHVDVVDTARAGAAARSCVADSRERDKSKVVAARFPDGDRCGLRFILAIRCRAEVNDHRRRFLGR